MIVLPGKSGKLLLLALNLQQLVRDQTAPEDLGGTDLLLEPPSDPLHAAQLHNRSSWSSSP
jgi:hypothetical protein